MKTKILMVCLGNICRSPLAEGILKSKVDPNKIYVDSAGTGDYHVGHSPDERSVAIAQKNGFGYYLSTRDVNFLLRILTILTRIYVMDMTNYHDVLSLARNEEDKAKVSLILNEVFPEENVEVPDPYHGGTDGFT